MPVSPVANKLNDSVSIDYVETNIAKLRDGTLYDLIRKCWDEKYNFPSFSDTETQLKNLRFVKKDGEIDQVVKDAIEGYVKSTLDGFFRGVRCPKKLDHTDPFS